jgi:hypothetical protein
MGLEDITSMTSKDRILLHLSDFSHMEDRYELPVELIQERIAFSTGVQRKHLSQYLNDLMEEGLVTERKAHIQGMKQRMNGYYLTASGYAKAMTLRNHIGQVSVPIRIDGRAREMLISQIDDATSVHITYCDIIRLSIQKGRLDLADLNNVELAKRQALEKEEQSTDTFKRALETVWRDGRVTATERFLVEELRKHLKITYEQHRALEEEILKNLAQDHMEFIRIYKGVLEVALTDGALSGPEVEILENLRRVFRISRQEHDAIIREVETAICGPPGCDKVGSSFES